MKNFTEDLIRQIDDNGEKALSILQALTYAVEMDRVEEEGINVLYLLKAAVDYLDQNGKIFAERL